MTRPLCAALLVLSGFASVARAQNEPPAGGMPAPAESAPPGGMPAPAESGPPAPGAAGPVVPPGELAEDAPHQRIADLSYGVAARLRWVSVPAWLLNVFTKKNVPLSSWGTGIEFFRRKANFDLVLSFSYQNMSPPPGNWLGEGHDATVDTDYVVFNNLSMLGADLSFVWHTNFNEWFGIHYGAGIGLAWVRGDILRISNGSGCTEMNAGDINQCHPIGVMPNGSSTLPIPRDDPDHDPGHAAVATPVRRHEQAARAADHQRCRRRQLPAAPGARLGGPARGRLHRRLLPGRRRRLHVLTTSGSTRPVY